MKITIHNPLFTKHRTRSTDHRSLFTVHRALRAFTLIELLVVMAIVAIALGVSLFGLANSRAAARDNRRVADLEAVRSALEIYRADCGVYPATSELTWGQPLRGTDTPVSCSSSNIYMQELPQDVVTTQSYYYNNPDDGTYILCASLEGTAIAATGCGACGSGVMCTYSVSNP